MPDTKHVRISAVFKAYAKAAGKYPWLLGASVLGVLGVEIGGLVGPLYLREFVNVLSAGLSSAGTTRTLILTLGAYTLIQLIVWLFRRLNDFSLMLMEIRGMRDLYNEAFEKLMRHSHEFFISTFTGTLTRRVMRYARAFEQVWDNVIYNFLPAAIFAVGAVGVLAVHNAVLGGLLLGWTVVFVSLQFYMAHRLQSRRLTTSEADSAITGAVSDTVLNHPAVTTFAALVSERTRFGEVVARWIKAATRSWSAQLSVNAVQGFLGIFIEVGLLYAAIFYWQSGALTIGDFVLIQVYVLGLMDRIWSLGRNMRNLYEAFSDATEMLDIIELPLDIKDTPGARPITVTDGAIRFDHVRFAYHDGQEVLADCSLSIAPREKVAVVGPSGAGKSTITKLLLRLYDVTEGAVMIDGQNIAEVTQESLRRAIAFVPQEPSLFHRTLCDNIRYGRPDASDEEVREAARQAHCLEFIERYPDGFDTLVGERGVKLSGGERQRIAIARAILKDAPILVLDEATSSLDSESEALIQDALGKLMEGKTVIAIAHRLSTIMHMDRIIVMEGGNVVLSGTHQELLAQESNLYKKLWEIQAGGFITAS